MAASSVGARIARRTVRRAHSHTPVADSVATVTPSSETSTRPGVPRIRPECTGNCVLDADCPYLNFASQGPDGALSFSNWVYSPAATLLYDAAPACMVTLPAGASALDPDPLVFAEVTGGYEAAAVTMLEDGDALLSVFVDDNVAFDPETDDVYSWIFGANWKSYQLDLATGETTEVPGLGWHSGGYYTANLDGRDYVLLPGADYASTVVYALDADGASPVTTTAGWSTRLYKVR